MKAAYHLIGFTNQGRTISGEDLHIAPSAGQEVTADASKRDMR